MPSAIATSSFIGGTVRIGVNIGITASLALSVDGITLIYLGLSIQEQQYFIARVSIYCKFQA